jgi:hypothetical protein
MQMSGDLLRMPSGAFGSDVTINATITTGGTITSIVAPQDMEEPA